MPRTIIEKLWDSHVVAQQPGAPALLYIDLHLVHEVTSPQAFQGLRERKMKVRRPDLTVATMDHSIPTSDRSLPIVDPIAAALRNAPNDDEPESEEEKRAVAEAHDWLARNGGKGIPHGEAMRKFGLE